MIFPILLRCCFGSDWNSAGSTPLDNVVLTVPTDVRTIQDAIDICDNFSVIMVEPGVYHEQIDFGGKAVLLTSTNPKDYATTLLTVIDGNGTGPVISFDNSESYSSYLCGFTVRGGNAVNGGGIYCSGSSPTVSDCIISDNFATANGAGIFNTNSNPLIVNCIFRDNNATGAGIVYNSNSSTPNIINCLLNQNSGGAVYSDSSSPVLTNCTIVSNTDDTYAAIHSVGTSNPSITNCILWNNQANGSTSESSQIAGGSPVINHCCVMGWTGNLGGSYNSGSDPQFAGPASWHLSSTSSYLDAGDDSALPSFVLKDLGGEDRFAGNGTVDIGAYEGPKAAIDIPTDFVFVPKGYSETFLVSLPADPGSQVAVTVEWYAGDPDVSVTSGSSLTFNSANYSTGQQVTLSSDPAGDGFRGQGLIRISAEGFATEWLIITDGSQNVIYVDDTASSGTPDGSSWTNAYPYLQDAIAAAVTAGVPTEICVAEGRYYPDHGTGITLGNRSAYFELHNGIAIYGGFPDGGGYWEDRDPIWHETVLSGDLDLDGDDDPNSCDNIENSYHVIYSAGVNSTAVINGFTVAAGNANGGGYFNYAGGMYNTNGACPTVSDCVFLRNCAITNGGGVYNNDSCPLFSSCVFAENAAPSYYGGGMANVAGSVPVLLGCVFRENAAMYGGGIYCDDNCNAIITNCVFTNNIATDDGGAIHADHSAPQLVNCGLIGNYACSAGAGVYSSRTDGSSNGPMLINCTVAQNVSRNGGGGMFVEYSYPVIVNSIFWGNQDNRGIDESAQIYGGTLNVSYSCIQGLDELTGNGNIGSDPCFIDNLGHLHWASLCIDTGDDAAIQLETDLDGENRKVGTVDMGAYEGARQVFVLSREIVNVPEGDDAWFSVSLAMEPVEPLSVAVTWYSGNPDISVDSGASLVFDASNYSVPQDVILSSDTNGTYEGTAYISISAPGSASSFVTAVEGNIIYVRKSAAGSADGSDWANAYPCLQCALGQAWNRRLPTEIRVAAETYYPDEGTGFRSEYFELHSGVAVYGGFPSAGGSWVERDPVLHETILSGDLEEDDGPDFTYRDDNSFHVVYSEGVNNSAILDGFIITAGNADTEYDYLDNGGGMLNYMMSNPVISNCSFVDNYAFNGGAVYSEKNILAEFTGCTFSNNYADDDGGALYNVDSKPIIVDSEFSSNVAGRNGGAVYNDSSSSQLMECDIVNNSAGTSGGGVYDRGNSCPTFLNCQVTSNVADASGGGLYNSSSAPILVNCAISENIAYSGGGLYSTSSSPMLVNCIINENSADSLGGGLYNSSSNPILINCRFSSNDSNSGGGLFNYSSDPKLVNCTLINNSANSSGGGIYNSSTGSNPVVVNSILWNNKDSSGQDESAQIHGGILDVSYSCIQDGTPGDASIPFGGASNGNIDGDPCFIDSLGHLHWASLCIDAGDDAAIQMETDLDSEVRKVGTVDMGVYEGARQVFMLSREILNVPEGDDAGFAISLAMEPVEPLSVTVAWDSGNPDISVASGASLMFDASNYSVPQDVILTSDTNGTSEGIAYISISALGSVSAFVTAVEGNIIYVDKSALGIADGSDWDNAYLYLQDALTEASNASLPTEIRVAAETYYPDEGAGINVYDRTVSFELHTGVAIYGGFPSAGGSWVERDPVLHETILSGDLEKDDGPEFTYRDDNSYHVVYSERVDNTAILDGFTVTAGNADGSGDLGNGGGMLNYNLSDPIILNCSFMDNYAVNGGALYNGEKCDPKINDCSFEQNLVTSNGGGVYNSEYCRSEFADCEFANNGAGNGGAIYSVSCAYIELARCSFILNSVTNNGGAIYNDSSSQQFIECDIIGNSADTSGGGVYNYDNSHSTFLHCDVSGNFAGTSGGGIYNSSSNPELINCLVRSNSANTSGGGLYNTSSGPTLINCTVIGNSADSSGGGIYNSSTGSNQVVINSILWNNEDSGGQDESAQLHGGTVDVSYSCIQDDTPGDASIPFGGTSNGNIDSDPYFSDTFGRLRWDSHCIDSGNTSAVYWNYDLDGNHRVLNGDWLPNIDVDMGCYEAPSTDGRPFLSASSDIVRFRLAQDITDDYTLYVINSYQGTLNWQLSEDCDWLETDVSFGSCSAGNSSSVVVSADTTSMSPGYYTSQITVTDNDSINGSIVVGVVLSVYGQEDEIHVPLEYPNLQDAIDAVDDDETIILAGGSQYVEPIIMPANKNIHITSTDPLDPETVADTVITGNFGESNPGFVITVQTGSTEDPTGDLLTCVIEGITITGGYGTTSENGGGIICTGIGSVEINRCVLQSNTGSAIYCDGSNASDDGDRSSLTVYDTLVANNYITAGSGAIHCTTGTLDIDSSIVQENTGSGIYFAGTDLSIVDSFVINNNAVNGGGLQCIDCDTSSISGSVFTGNTATGDGGAIYHNGSLLTLTACTINANTASGYGGGIYDPTTTSLIVGDCILWGNEDTNGTIDTSQIYGGTPSVGYSCIQDDVPGDASVPFGGTNIDVDPTFANALSIGGPSGILGTLDDGLRLEPESPCVGIGYTGDDMGAYNAFDCYEIDVITNEDVPVNITLVSEEDYDLPLGFYVLDIPEFGDLTVNGRVGTYSPIPDYNGSDSFRFYARDDTAYSNLITVNITVSPVDDAPVVEDMEIVTYEDTPVAFALWGTLIDNDPLTYSVVSNPTYGTADVQDNIVTYTPTTLDYNGSDSFTYKANDGTDSNVATVYITIIPLPEIWCVNNAVSGGSYNGRSWDNAFDELQDALAIADPCDQIWVAAGNAPYVPGSSPSDTFSLAEGVAVYGGFAGDENYLQERDWMANLTILSGQLASDNCYHVVTGNNDATLDGFMIAYGDADGAGDNAYGGGLFNNECNTSVKNCMFVANDAVSGGVIYNKNCSTSVLLADSTLLNSSSGPAIYNQDSKLVVMNSIIYSYAGGSSTSISNNGTTSVVCGYSNIEGCGGSGASWNTAYGTDGGNNIDQTPVFVDADGVNNVLGTSDDDLTLTAASPGKDVGIAGQDMGAAHPIVAEVTNSVSVDGPTDMVWYGVDSLFVLTVSSSGDGQVVVYNSQLVLQQTITISANYPKGLALGCDGAIYISDTGNNRILKYVDSGSGYGLDSSFGTAGVVGQYGTGEGEFDNPWGIVVDRAGYVYVVDSGNNRIQVFDPSGQFDTQYGEYGSAEGQFDGPKSCCLIDDYLWIADTGNNRIQWFRARSGTFGGSFGTYGSGAGEFDAPTDICYDPIMGQITALDEGNDRVQTFQQTDFLREPSVPTLEELMNAPAYIYETPLSVSGVTSIGIRIADDAILDELLYLGSLDADEIETLALGISSRKEQADLFNGLCLYLKIGDFDSAMEYILSCFRYEYEQMFLVLSNDLANIISTWEEIHFRMNVGPYMVVFEFTVGGKRYPVVFSYEYGGWYISRI